MMRLQQNSMPAADWYADSVHCVPGLREGAAKGTPFLRDCMEEADLLHGAGGGSHRAPRRASAPHLENSS